MTITDMLWCATCGGSRKLDHSCIVPTVPDRTRRRTTASIVHVRDEHGKPTKIRKIVKNHDHRKQTHREPTCPRARVLGENNARWHCAASFKV